MVLYSFNLRLVLLKIIISHLCVSECEKVYKSCCPKDEILSLSRDKLLSCVNGTNLSPHFLEYNIGQRKDSKLDKCDYEVHPITRLSETKEWLCIDELTFTNDNNVSITDKKSPYLVGLRCKDGNNMQNMTGINKCCKMGETFCMSTKKCVKMNGVNDIDQKIEEGKMFAAVGMYSVFVKSFELKLKTSFHMYEERLSYFMDQRYIKEFANSPVEYCIEDSVQNDTVVVVVRNQHSDSVPQCVGFDKYLHAKPNSELGFEKKYTKWNLTDDYDDIFQFKDLFVMKVNVSWFLHEKECSKEMKEYPTYTFHEENYIITYQPYSHSYNLDICTGVIFGGKRTGNRELFSCRSNNDDWILLKKVSLIIGFICNVATFIVYGYLQSLRNLFGKSLMVYLICRMGLTFLNITINFEVEAMQVSFYVGMIKYFFDISKTIWMFLLSHEVWTTMRTISVHSRAEIAAEGRKFINYIIGSFTVSFCITIYLVVDDVIQFSKILSDREHNTDTWTIMQFISMANNNKRNNLKFLILYVIPTSIFVIINLAFYVHTLVHIFRIKGEINSTGYCFKNRHKFNTQYGLILRLFCAMGLVWMFNVPALIMSYPELNISSDRMDLVLPEILSSLESMLLFCIFIVKRSIFKKIYVHFREQLTNFSNWSLTYWQNGVGNS